MEKHCNCQSKKGIYDIQSLGVKHSVLIFLLILFSRLIYEKQNSVNAFLSIYVMFEGMVLISKQVDME